MSKPVPANYSVGLSGDYSQSEEWLNFLSHGLATLFSLAGTVLLVVLGIVCKLVFGHRYHAVQVGVYLGMGWLIVLAFRELADTVNPLGVWLVVAGGLVYTLGVVFYALKRVPFNHAIWHVFVVGGSTCHFLAIYHGVLNGQSY